MAVHHVTSELLAPAGSPPELIELPTLFSSSIAAGTVLQECKSPDTDPLNKSYSNAQRAA
jgi:hypothetical protein